ncbi:MAG: DUF523 domain-containing protein [Clostridiales bacterium]|nr:DUF523 domain-containing protein [Clostridiales bacterium]
MIKILVSECLYGERIVRYDGKENRLDDPRFLQWKQEGRLVAVCPEVMGGLSTPRTPSERRGGCVVNSNGHDVTNEYTKGAKLALAIAKRENVSCVLFKLNSPSCGSKLIYDGSFTGNKIAGQGVAAELLRDNGYQVYGEDDLDQIEKLIMENER